MARKELNETQKKEVVKANLLKELQEEWDNFEDLFIAVKKDYDKFIEKGFATAGTKVRLGIQNLKKTGQNVRILVQNIKNV